MFVVDSTDKLLSFELPTLAPGKSQDLGAHCLWGPQRVGKLVLVATEKGPLSGENGRLFAIDEQQQVVWQSDLRYGPLAGRRTWPATRSFWLPAAARSGGSPRPTAKSWARSTPAAPWAPVPWSSARG